MHFMIWMTYIVFIQSMHCHVASLRNFALNKRAYQSSTENYNNFNWTADKAVDGNTDGRNPGTSRTCSKTDVRMGNHTWEVDIGYLIIVKNITVYERSDGNDQLSGFQVLIGNHSLLWNTNKPLEEAPSGHFQHLFRASDSLARFITVIRQNKETLTLCEVVVHGECLDGMYSTFCDRTCGKCSNGQPCNKVTGECVHGCEPGWTGSLCDKGLRNFALKKRAYQSSTENYNNFDWTADKAVDGNTDGRNPDTSRTCSETDIRMGIHTWEVDIGFLIIVKSITVYERSDGTDQLSGFKVLVGNSSLGRNSKLLEKEPSGHFQHLFRAGDSLARFISVIRENKETLTLCEVVVYGECLDGMYSTFCDRTCGKCSNGQPCNKDTGECVHGCEPGWTGSLCDKGLRNFALKKRAYQSSTENYNNFDWTADKAVDGNTDGRNPDTSRTCSETDIRMGIHTWEVDIGFLIIVKSITVYERSDGTDQLSGFKVLVGNSSLGRNSKLLEKEPSGHFQHLFRAGDSLARFISVIRENKETLTLCEVVVYGECLDGMYSTFCDRTCGKCSNGQPCNKDTGECVHGCEPGWTGSLCDKGLRNFALNKRAYQSSTENYNNFDWTADKAVDGNTDGRNPDTSRTCSETDIRMGIHTWEVDIGFLIIVKSITVYERSDGNDQLSGFEVFIGNHSWPWNATKPLERAPSGHFHHIFRPSDTLAKFITVVRQSKETLTLCEVVVHGECLDGMYSELCNRTCGKCFNGQLCNKDTGECPRGCEPDWTGLLCDRAHIVMTGNDSSENLTQTFSRVDVTVIVGSVIGLCVVVVIINIITVGVLKKRRSNDTRDSRMKMKETGAAAVESREVTLIAENEYMELQDRGRM